MKDNLEAKFYEQIFASTIKEISTIKQVSFKIDVEIDNPSNKNVIDCTSFYKESSKLKKSKNINIVNNQISTSPAAKNVRERYNLANFIVGLRLYIKLKPASNLRPISCDA